MMELLVLNKSTNSGTFGYTRKFKMSIEEETEMLNNVSEQLQVKDKKAFMLSCKRILDTRKTTTDSMQRVGEILVMDGRCYDSSGQKMKDSSEGFSRA